MLDRILFVASSIGRRPDYTQGGGGNISWKDTERMYVKASGLRLDELQSPAHFVPIQFAHLRSFHQRDATAVSLPDLISENEQVVTGSIIREALTNESVARPSIETGFHAILGHVVLHTHSVYTNIMLCAKEGKELCETLFPDALYIPYNTPGIALSLAIEAAKETKGSDVIFLENHGLIIVADTPEEALDTHELVNTQLRQYFKPSLYPKLSISLHEVGWQSNSPALQQFIRVHPELTASFATRILFPDQAVYGAAIGFDPIGDTKIRVDLSSGSVVYACGRNEALAIEETLAAWFYIQLSMVPARLTPRPLPATEGVFIANLDSEKYRKSLL